MIPSFAQPSLIGQRYKVIQRLGGGAMGAVFLATDNQRSDERVAIKVPAASRHWRAEYERRVLKEIGILSALQHPNIIAIQDWGQDPQLGPYIVMEYIEGGSILQLMAKYPGQRLGPLESLRMAATVADALAYAHSRQPPIIHRDIKPDNVLIRSSDGQIKVTDFGLAAVLTGRRAMTQWGTPDYIAPEQALGKGADGRSDMYGLAATLYHMLTGLRPPSLGLPLPARPSAALTPGILDAVQARRIDFLIITLMAYDPNDRRPSPDRKPWRATEVAEELRAIAEHRPAQVYPGLEDSAIFPSLMTSMIPPVGAAPAQRAQQQRVPPPPPPPQQIAQPPLAQAQRAPGPELIQPIPQMPAPLPAPAQPPLQAEQFFPPPPPQAPPPPEQARHPSAIIPPLPRPTAGFQNPPAPAVQVQPPQIPPQPPNRVAPTATSRRSLGISAPEIELIAGLLVGIASAAVLFFTYAQLPQVNIQDVIFKALVFGLILWGAGLLVGAASPRGRSGRLPWLALLVATLTVAIGFPLAQAVRAGEGLFHNLSIFVLVLTASPFLFLGAVGTWLIMKLMGR
ncbi:MAG TPA: serine/threonine-protein kinase [Ktedonobacterales bacterium]|jgi:serine/threonine protein kinase